MKFVAIVIVLFNITGLASAQAPPVAGIGPTMSLSAGYSYVSVGLPSSDRVGLIGPEVSLTLDFRSYLGLTTDLGYARRSHVLGTTHHADLLSYMAGPVIYPVRFRRCRIDGHVLVGGTRITGVVPVTGGMPFTAWANDLSWAVGSNVEFRAPGGINVRAGVEYVRASFFDSSLSIKRQGNVKVGLSVVYRFGAGRRRYLHSDGQIEN
jgi:hypothetical protein